MARLRNLLAMRDGRLALSALLVALVVRVGDVAATDLPLRKDPFDYHQHALSIAAGHGFPPSNIAPGGGPSAFRPPGYPYFLGGIYAVTGNSVRAARLVQALLGTLTVGLIGLLALQLFGRRVGLVALALAAIYPPLVLSTDTLITEAVFLPLMLGALTAAVGFRRSSARSWRGPVLIGLLVGLAVLVRPVGAALIPSLVIALWARESPRSWRAAAAPAAMLAAALLTVSPWVIRNAVVLDKPMLSTEGFIYLSGTFNDVSRADNRVPASIHLSSFVPRYRSFLVRGDLNEVQVEDRLRHETLLFIRRHPGYVLKAAYYNTARMFGVSGGHDFHRLTYASLGIGQRSADLAIYGFYVMAILALLGLFTHGARRAPAFIWLTPVLLLLVPGLVQGVARYRLPAEPFIVMLAALTLVALADRLSGAGAKAQGSEPTGSRGPAPGA